MRSIYLLEAVSGISASIKPTTPTTIDQQLSILLNIFTIVLSIITIASFSLKFFLSAHGKFNSRKKDDLTLIKEIDYANKISMSNHKNSYLFSLITNREASIDKISQILNCSDPRKALLIYSKSPSYINFNSVGIPKCPTIIKILIYFIYSQLLLIAIGLCLGFHLINLIGFVLPLNSLDKSVAIPKLLFIGLAFVILAIFFFVYILYYYLSELNMIFYAKDFYKKDFAASLDLKNKSSSSLDQLNCDFKKGDCVQWTDKENRFRDGKVLERNSDNVIKVRLSLKSWMERESEYILKVLIKFIKIASIVLVPFVIIKNLVLSNRKIFRIYYWEHVTLLRDQIIEIGCTLCKNLRNILSISLRS